MKKVVALLFAPAALGLLFLGSAAERDEVRNVPDAPVEFSGEMARHYLQETADGQSLMQALTAARFALQWREYVPDASKSSGGYLGMSHEQDLNAWFAEDGVTVRPTVSREEQAQAWQLAFRLRAYGYGDELAAAPPIVSRSVKGNRIEYERSHNRFAVEAAVSAALLSDSQATRLPLQREASPKLVEWYENRPEGIEQGFTVNEPPPRQSYVLNEELRLVLAVEGDLHAIVKQDGQAIELANKEGRQTISYSNLVAFDAEGKRLAARMEASADGREIALLVEDRNAAYPVVIDPVIATLERKLEAFTAQQADARFGFAVAIEGDRAIVGAWREDFGALADVGVVYTFTRSGTSWSLNSRNNSGSNANEACGWSVAIKGPRIAYGCPGANSQAGRAFLRTFGSSGSPTEIIPPSNRRDPGDQFGFSIALGSENVVVGAPFFTGSSTPNVGAAFLFDIGANAIPVFRNDFGGTGQQGRCGYAVAIDGDTMLVGCPTVTESFANPNLAEHGQVDVYEHHSSGDWFIHQFLNAKVPKLGENFGNSVAIDGNTFVVGAFGADDIAADAGAAYVFIRGGSGLCNNTPCWTQQQKLTASDGRAGDFFSDHAVAVEGDTIVVGADGWDEVVSGDNAGAAYVFTRSGSVWTLQTALYGKAAENFGISVDLSGDSLLIGARGANVTGTARAGAAFVYRLPHTLANVSTRLRVETGDNALIGGFIITGTQPKKVMVRAIGPSLPLAGTLADPQLQIFNSSGTEIAFNNNWRDATNRQEIIDSTIAPGNDLESAVLRTFNPGDYTAVVRGVNDTTGVGVVEAYDLDTAANSKLANISTRGLVQTGDDVMIAGTIVVGATPQKVMVRAIGPSLTLPNRLLDPTLELRDSNGALVEANDNWGDSPNKQAITDSGIAPTHSLESAIVRTVSPASYTAIVRGVNNTTGIAVVEVYALQ